MKLSLYAFAGLVIGASSSLASADTLYSSADSGFYTGAPTATSPNGTDFIGPLTQGASTTTPIFAAAAGSTFTLTFDLYAVRSLDGNGPAGGNGPGLNQQDNFIVTSSTSQTPIFINNFANFDGDTQQYPNPYLDPNLPVSSASNPAQTGAYATNGLGYGTGSFGDSEYHISATGLVGSAGQFSLTFTGASNQSADDEFYGFGNILLTGVPASPPPAGAPAPLAGAGLLSFLGAGAISLRKRGKQVIGLLLSRWVMAAA